MSQPQIAEPQQSDSTAVRRAPAWFERRFTFDFPVELMPNLLARLRGTPARLEEAMRGLSAEARTRKAGGRWSAMEQAGHLLVMEPLWLARVEDYVRRSDGLTVADLANRATDEGNFNARELEDVLSGFRTERTKLVARVEELGPELYARGDSASAAEDADAARGSFVLCGRA